ncbi:MAG: hypothetical protein KJT01_11185 [Gemmatimonadetes bacterium]|nr:hypothetical protein [Gemmatimonadota bacterium]
MIFPPFRRVANGGGGQRQRTARAVARAVLRPGGLRAVATAVLAAGCSGDGRDGVVPPRVALPPGLGVAAVQWQQEAPGWTGRVPGDSAVRLSVRPRVEDAATRRLCGFLVTDSRLPARLPEHWSVDSAVPRLLVRPIRGDALEGIRYLTPGAGAHFWFEGLSRDGAWRVSLRWPVRSDAARPIPANATDSVMEAALQPAPSLLDAMATGLVVPPSRTARSGWPLPSEGEAEEGAVILARDFPDQTLALSDACPQATVLMPVVARMDKRLRIPVRRGDRVVARGTVLDGAVRLAFDEAPPTPEDAIRERALLRAPVPEAALTATEDGRLTLRVRLLVVPRAQQAVQPVRVTVAVNPSR